MTAPRRPRRTEPDPGPIGAGFRGGLPTAGTSHGVPVTTPNTPPIVPQCGEIVAGTSHPGAGAGTAIHNYADRASQPKSGAVTVNAKQPFNLTK